MQKVFLLVGLISVGLLSGCFHDLGANKPDQNLPIDGIGTIEFVNLEGGFFGIVDDDGTRYFPLNLPVEFNNNGLRVAYQVQIAKDVATTQQWGIAVNVLFIQSLN